MVGVARRERDPGERVRPGVRDPGRRPPDPFPAPVLSDGPAVVLAERTGHRDRMHADLTCQRLDCDPVLESIIEFFAHPGQPSRRAGSPARPAVQGCHRLEDALFHLRIAGFPMGQTARQGHERCRGACVMEPAPTVQTAPAHTLSGLGIDGHLQGPGPSRPHLVRVSHPGRLHHHAQRLRELLSPAGHLSDRPGEQDRKPGLVVGMRRLPLAGGVVDLPEGERSGRTGRPDVGRYVARGTHTASYVASSRTVPDFVRGPGASVPEVADLATPPPGTCARPHSHRHLSNTAACPRLLTPNRNAIAVSDRIPDAELEVLTVVQREKGATAREVLRAIRSFRPLAHSSVMTLLGRLEERGLVRGEPAERREFRFIATGTRNEAVEPLLRRLLDRVFEGDAAGLVAALFETRPPTADEVARLETLLANLSESLSPEDGP